MRPAKKRAHNTHTHTHTHTHTATSFMAQRKPKEKPAQLAYVQGGKDFTDAADSADAAENEGAARCVAA